MIGIEEKLHTFTKLVLGKAHEESENMIEENNRKTKELLHKKEEEVEKKSKEIIEKKIEIANYKRKKMIANAKADAKREIMDKKSRLLYRLITETEEKVKKLKQSEEYSSYLVKSIKKGIEELEGTNKIIIYLESDDKVKYEELIKKECIDVNLDFKSCKQEILGGVYLTDENQKIKIDFTLKGMLEEEVDEIGYMLYEALKEEGEGYEF